MNYPLVWRQLGKIAVLIGAWMTVSLPWAWFDWPVERYGFWGLVLAMLICFAVGGWLLWLGRNSNGRLFRKEAMAIVGLSWVLATILGGLPFVFSGTYRTPDTRMSIVDALFESQSGFSTTGATVITDLESPELIPRCILFWRSSTHFLGGLGIIVLFVAVLGMGSAGKALMRAEMPGPSNESPQARMQHTAWVLFFLYTALNGVLTVILWFEGLSWFDALCHAFGTMATGGFSTYNASVGHFAMVPGYNGPLIESTIIVFMILAGSNFMLLYFLLLRQPGHLLVDVEWRTYIAVIALATLAVLGFGIYHHDFDVVMTAPSVPIEQEGGAGDVKLASGDIVPPDAAAAEQRSSLRHFGDALRYSLFQVVSIMTTTGYGTHDFDRWNSFARGVLFLLMFVGGCAGSTGGGLKVIRHVLFLKILGLEVEHSFHPSVVRPLRLGGKPVEDQDLRKNILVYFGLILVIFVFSWMLLVTMEPDSTWQSHRIEHKLIDSASGIAATLNNIGPGLGTVGATQNYSHFSWPGKLLFTWLMMLGRLEVFVILVLFLPRFWRTQ